MEETREEIYQKVIEVGDKYNMFLGGQDMYDMTIKNHIEDAISRSEWGDLAGGSLHGILATFFEMLRAKSPENSRIGQLLFDNEKIMKAHNAKGIESLEHLAYYFAKAIEEFDGDMRTAQIAMRQMIFSAKDIQDNCIESGEFASTALQFFDSIGALNHQKFDVMYDKAEAIYDDMISNVHTEHVDQPEDFMLKAMSSGIKEHFSDGSKFTTFGMMLSVMYVAVNMGILEIGFGERFFAEIEGYLHELYGSGSVVDDNIMTMALRLMGKSFHDLYNDALKDMKDKEEDDEEEDSE